MRIAFVGCGYFVDLYARILMLIFQGSALVGVAELTRIRGPVAT